MNEYINLTLENIDNEHLCCAIGDKKHDKGVSSKKEWLKSRIKEGHVFRKLNTHGKVFIEYAPLDTAWAPISGNKFMYIYCLWVAGSYKGHGYAKELLEYAIKDAQDHGYNGLCTISSKKKKPFISEGAFFKHYNFKVVDTVDDYELLSLSFNNQEPSFNGSVHDMKINNNDLTIYYSNQCPYVVNCVEQLEEYSKESGNKIVFKKVDTLEKAKEIPCVFNNWSVFKDGKFVSNTLLNKNSVAKLFN